jgi:transcriptional regulator with XRE-family HTH domain
MSDTRARRRLTPVEVVEVRERAARGETYLALASAFGVSPSAVSRIARGLSGKRTEAAGACVPGPRRAGRRPQYSERTLEMVRTMRAAGLSSYAVADATGVPASTIRTLERRARRAPRRPVLA